RLGIAPEQRIVCKHEWRLRSLAGRALLFRGVPRRLCGARIGWPRGCGEQSLDMDVARRRLRGVWAGHLVDAFRRHAGIPFADPLDIRLVDYVAVPGASRDVCCALVGA